MKTRFSKKDQIYDKPESVLLISGYGGLTYLAKDISQIIPRCKIYVEPFAGLGRIAKLVNSDKMILNDLSEYCVNFLTVNFPDAVITKEDFIDCIKRWDSEDTFFFIDPPWSKRIYQNHKESCFTMPDVKSYYIHLFYWLPQLKGKWIITSDNAEMESKKALSKSGYANRILRAKDGSPRFYGHLPVVRLCSNFTLNDIMENREV